MQDFYRKALIAFSLLLAADALIAWCCFHLRTPTATLIPWASGAARWHAVPVTDAALGGASTVRIHEAGPRSLRFDFTLSQVFPHPWAWAALVFDDADGKPAPADWSKYSTMTFLARCSPANSLVLYVTTVDTRIVKPGGVHPHMPAVTYFSCNEKGMPVSLDLTRLAIPEWWHLLERVDITRQSYQLDKVVKLEFGGSRFSPRDRPSHVEISELTLRGRDDRYVAALAAVLVAGWGAFGAWFFRAQSRALLATLHSRLAKDLSFVAYRQLTVEPFEDQEKAAILRYIATHYAEPGLDTEAVAAGAGADRHTIAAVLKSELGMTFNGYLKKLRLTEAARLLSDKPSATVTEIAHSVGYPNITYFNRLFKEEYGRPPREFKQLAARPGAAASRDRTTA